MEGNSKIGNMAGADGENSIDVLDNLAPNTWVGHGFNLIAVPCVPGKPDCELGFRLELQSTLEILKFSKVSKALDRGAREGNAHLRAARYLQTVIDRADGRSVIHNEPGLWVHVLPSAQNASEEGPTETFVRLGVTPHGDSILAQSTSFGPATLPLKIGSVNSYPFSFENGIEDIPPLINGNTPNQLDDEYLRPYKSIVLPQDLKQKGVPDADIVKDPAKILQADIPDQLVLNVDVIEISTNLPNPKGIQSVLKDNYVPSNLTKVQTAGITNIFADASRADAVLMDAMFWVETMVGNKADNPRYRLQYLQRVILDFPAGNQMIHWPHISGATLKNVA